MRLQAPVREFFNQLADFLQRWPLRDSVIASLPCNPAAADQLLEVACAHVMANLTSRRSITATALAYVGAWERIRDAPRFWSVKVP